MRQLDGLIVMISLEPYDSKFWDNHLVKLDGDHRWRPHLIYHKDVLPEQTNKEIATMLQKLQDIISQILGIECMPITKDLLDYYHEEI